MPHVQGQMARHVVQAARRDHGLGLSQRAFRAEILTIEVALLEDVAVAQPQAPHAQTRQQGGHMSPQTAAAQHEDTGLQQADHCIGGKNAVVSTEAFRPDAVLQERDHHLPFGKDGPRGQLPDGGAADEGRAVRCPAQHMRPGPCGQRAAAQERAEALPPPGRRPGQERRGASSFIRGWRCDGCHDQRASNLLRQQEKRPHEHRRISCSGPLFDAR